MQQTTAQTIPDKFQIYYLEHFGHAQAYLKTPTKKK